VAHVAVTGAMQFLGSFGAKREAVEAYREAEAAVAQGKPLPARREPISSHRGVSWNKAGGNWWAIISAGGKRRHLGCFDSEEEAAKAYLQAVAAVAQGGGGSLPARSHPGKPTSKHKGVSLHTANCKWTASIRLDGKLRHLGCFAAEEEAAAAHREAAAAIARGLPLPTRSRRR
jgi:hypothetical protein